MRRSSPKPLYGLILAIAIAHFACKPTQQAAPADPQKAPAAVVSPYLDFSGEYYPDEIQGSDMYLVISKKPADSLNYKVLWASPTKQIKQAPGLGLQHNDRLFVVRGTNPAVAYLTQQQNQWVSHVVQGNSDLIANGLTIIGPKSKDDSIGFRLKLSNLDKTELSGHFSFVPNDGLFYFDFKPTQKDYAPIKGMAYKMEDGSVILVWNLPQAGASHNSNAMLSLTAYEFRPNGNKLEAKGFGAEYGDSNAMPVGLQPK